MEKDELREALAAYAHEAWSHWMRYMFSKCQELHGAHPFLEDELLIPQASVRRWKRQMATAYADLPEQEKASDRDEADKILKIFTGRAKKC